MSGPSGAGKGTLIAYLLARLDGISTAVSATTRARRDGERDGIDYHFLSRERFESRVAAGDFLEHAEYAGNLYGTLWSEVDSRVARGESVILEIELQGARAVRARRPDALAVFIAPPSFDELARRLENRGTEQPGVISARLEVARRELAARGEFDHEIVNDDAERAGRELIAVVLAGTSARERKRATGV